MENISCCLQENVPDVGIPRTNHPLLGNRPSYYVIYASYMMTFTGRHGIARCMLTVIAHIVGAVTALVLTAGKPSIAMTVRPIKQLWVLTTDYKRVGLYEMYSPIFVLWSSARKSRG